MTSVDAVSLFSRGKRCAKTNLAKDIGQLLQATPARKSYAQRQGIGKDDLEIAAKNVLAAVERFLVDEEWVLTSLSDRLSVSKKSQFDDALSQAQLLWPSDPVKHRKAMCRLISLTTSREPHKTHLLDLKRGRIRLDHALREQPAFEDLLRLGLDLIGVEVSYHRKLTAYFACHPELLIKSIDAYQKSFWCITDSGQKDRSHWVTYVSRLAEIYHHLTKRRLSNTVTLSSRKLSPVSCDEGPGVAFVRRCIESLWPGISVGQIQHLIRAARVSKRA